MNKYSQRLLFNIEMGGISLSEISYILFDPVHQMNANNKHFHTLYAYIDELPEWLWHKEDKIKEMYAHILASLTDEQIEAYRSTFL